MTDIKAEIIYRESSVKNFLLKRYWLAEFIVAAFGFLRGSSIYGVGSDSVPLEIQIRWGRYGDLPIFSYCPATEGGEYVKEIHYGNIIAFIIVAVLIAVLPYVICPVVDKIRKYVCENTSLSLTGETVSGSCLFASEKDFYFPVEQIKRIKVYDNIVERILTGKTVVLKTDSSRIIIPCVYNADEISDAIREAMSINN